MKNFFKRLFHRRTVEKTADVDKPRGAVSRLITRVISWFRRGDVLLENNELIFSAVSRLSNALSSMPVRLYKGEKEVKDGPLARLAYKIGLRPNDGMTSAQLFKTLEACRDTSGNCFAMKILDEHGQLERIKPLDPDRVTPVVEKDSGELYYRLRPEQGQPYYINSWYIIHVPFISTNGYDGVNPINVLYNTLQYDEDIKKFSRDQLDKGVNAAIVMESPTGLGKQQVEDTIKDFQDVYKETGGNILFLESGIKAHTMDLKPVDTAVLDVEKISRGRVAMVYNIPPHLMGDYSQTSFKSQEQQALEFQSMTMLPIVTAYEQELNSKLLTEKQYMAGYRWKFDMDALLRADVATRAECNFKAVRSAWKTPDEVRREDGRPALPGGVGAKPLISKDMATLADVVAGKTLDNKGDKNNDIAV